MRGAGGGSPLPPLRRRGPRGAGAAVLLAALVAAGCAHVEEAYGPGPRHRLDLYLPEGRGPFPVLLFVPGGGWVRDGRFVRPGVPENVGRTLASAGWLVAIPGHRLAPDARVPDQAADVALAAAWLARESPRWGGDPGRLVLGGHSSGAHLAALVALDPSYGVCPRGVFCLSGVYDVPSLAREDRSLSGAFVPAFGSDPTAWPALSPLHHVARGAPPFLLLVGDREAGPVAADASSMAEALRLHGGTARFAIVPGRDHESLVVEFGSEGDPSAREVLRFLEELVPRRSIAARVSRFAGDQPPQGAPIPGSTFATGH